MEAPTIETEQAMCERLGRNRHAAVLRRMCANIQRTLALDVIANPIEMECIVCGEPMTAQRASKKTCSARCRLRWSRLVRAVLALPKAERRKREAELKKRWQRARAAEQGLMGERDIHRRPFEACDIPLYDSANELHREIAAVSAAACTELLPLASKMPVPVAQARKFARGRVAGKLARLDELTRQLLHAAPRTLRNTSIAAGAQHELL